MRGEGSGSHSEVEAGGEADHRPLCQSGTSDEDRQGLGPQGEF